VREFRPLDRLARASVGLDLIPPDPETGKRQSLPAVSWWFISMVAPSVLIGSGKIPAMALNGLIPVHGSQSSRVQKE
jgi:hypothetical protein